MLKMEASLASSEQQRKLFIGGLNPATTDDGLKAFYEQWGIVDDSVVMCDPVTKRSRGFGFITFNTPDSANRALSNVPHIIDNRQVDPKRATSREEMSSVEHRDAVKKVFVGGIGQDTQDIHLREYFSQFGNVQTASVMTDKVSGNSRGFGFIVFDNADDVDKLCSIRMHTVNGRKCEVKKALPRDDQSLLSSGRGNRGRRPGPYGERPSNFDSGAARSSHGVGRGDGYSTTSYGAYGSTYGAYGGLESGWKQGYNPGEYINPGTFGTGYQYGYSGGAMKSAGYSAKAAGPYGGGYGSASGYSAAPATGGAYSTSYPVSTVSGYTSYGGNAYGANAAPYSGGYAAYGSSY